MSNFPKLSNDEYYRLPDLILALLEREPDWTKERIIAELSYGPTAVRSALLKLKECDMAHFVARRTAGGLGLAQFWRAGPAPIDQENATVEAETRWNRPNDLRQVITKDFPDHTASRDPWLWSLFVPAQEVA